MILHLLHFLIGLVLVAMQLTLGNLITIFSIKPDFLIIFLVVRGLASGPTAGVIWGFGMGFLLDAVSGGLTGMGSLAYSVAGFIAGQVGAKKMVGRVHYMFALAFSVIAVYLIFLYFGEPWKEEGLLMPLLKHTLPGMIYTYGLGLMWMISPFCRFLVEKRRG
jgi:rod shape-determining protein MreD